MPTPTDTPLTYPTYTNRNLEDGIFEQLMAAVKHHVKEEYSAGRIQASDYAQVYLGLSEACLTNSTQFILGMLLIDEKRRGQDLANQKAEFELEFMLPAQLEMMQKEIEKIDAEISLMGKQEDKIDKEIEFLTWKIETEKANTQAGIAADGSLIGKQISLLTAQRLGFAGDLQLKVGKLYADYDSVYQSVQEPEGAISLLSGADAVGGPKEYTVEKLLPAEAIAASITALP